MNLSEADIILLEDYWAGRLTAAAQTNLEKRLAGDIAFQTVAAEWKMIVQESWLPSAEEAAEQAAIKARLLSYTDSATSEATTAKVVTPKPARWQRRIYIGLAAAASIALLWWVGGTQGQSSPYQAFFNHLPRENANLSNEVRDGKKAYDQHDYEVAYATLLAEVAAGADSLNLIYAGVAAVGSGQAEQAVAVLAPLANQETWAFYQAEIHWYLALAYLESNQNAKAKESLQTVIDAKGLYADEAKRLMTELKNK